jgi:hypothetical protein
VKLRAETPRVTADTGVLLIHEADHPQGRQRRASRGD